MNKYKAAATAIAFILASATPMLALAQTDPGTTPTMAPAPMTSEAPAVTGGDADDADDASDPAAMGPSGQYGDPICGLWKDGVWVGNTRCPGYLVGPKRAEVTGTITAVKGHLVTVQMSTRTVVINDQPALDKQTSGKVAVGRQIDAYGYWSSGTFYATRLV